MPYSLPGISRTISVKNARPAIVPGTDSGMGCYKFRIPLLSTSLGQNDCWSKCPAGNCPYTDRHIIMLSYAAFNSIYTILF